MPEHRLIQLIKEDPKQWPDLQHKIDLGAVEATDQVSLATIHRAAGAERIVVIRLDLPDGRAVLGEVPFNTFLEAADSMGAAQRVLLEAANDIEQAGKQ